MHVARKRFGQHFLSDAGVIDAVVGLIDPQAKDAIIEIGPGLAALTQPLLTHVDRLTVIELDRDLARRLRAQDRLTVIESDVLKVDFDALAKTAKQKLRIVGNLPYNISSPILFHLLPSASQVRDQHFMLQKEVVQRMVAKPCTAAYGRLSVMLQWRYEMENALQVPPESFEPPPRVDSAVVRMVPRADWPKLPIALLSELVRVAFSQRRKLLRHTLGPWLEKNRAGSEFDLQRRAQEVPVQEYLDLAARVRQAQE